MLQTRNLVLALAAFLLGGPQWGGLAQECPATGSVNEIAGQTGESTRLFGLSSSNAAGALGILRVPRVTPVTAPPALWDLEGWDQPELAEDQGDLALAGWISNKADNICGIDDLKKVSNPAQVDYPDLMAATPQMKRIKKDGIDPKSPLGKLLRREASSLITKACQAVRRAKGYCGIWKSISHSDHRRVTDATSDVKAELK